MGLGGVKSLHRVTMPGQKPDLPAEDVRIRPAFLAERILDAQRALRVLRLEDDQNAAWHADPVVRYREATQCAMRVVAFLESLRNGPLVQDGPAEPEPPHCNCPEAH